MHIYIYDKPIKYCIKFIKQNILKKKTDTRIEQQWVINA